jgi:hypothetical protein
MNFMRTSYRLALGLHSVAFAGQPLVAQLNTVTNLPATSDWAVVEMQANSQVWQRTTLETGPSGALFPRAHHFVQMAATPPWPVGAPGRESSMRAGRCKDCRTDLHFQRNRPAIAHGKLEKPEQQVILGG